MRFAPRCSASSPLACAPRTSRSSSASRDDALVADPLDPARVNVFERWESREDLDAWRAVAKAPRSKIKVGSVDVMMYLVGDLRPPFGRRGAGRSRARRSAAT